MPVVPPPPEGYRPNARHLPLKRYSKTWPISGMTHGGFCFPRPAPDLPTSESGSSSSPGPLLPSPTVSVFGDAEDMENWFNRRECLSGSWFTTTGDRSADLDGLQRRGDFALSIETWSKMVGRPEPDPTELKSRGRFRLTASFYEWLMGLDDGHVTGTPRRFM